MSWLKIDDGFTDNGKIEALSDRAFRLHVTGLCWCARNLTDGWITARSAKALLALCSAAKKHLDELVDRELWLPTGDGYSIKDYLEYNPPAEKVKADRRELSKKRREAGLKGAAARWEKGDKPDGNDDGKPAAVAKGLSMAPSRPVKSQSQEPGANAPGKATAKGRFRVSDHDAPKPFDFAAEVARVRAESEKRRSAA